MRKLLIIGLAMFFTASTKAQVAIPSYLTTVGVAQYPTNIDSLGKGGYMTVTQLSERDGIPSLRRKYGMLVYVKESDAIYQLKSITPGDNSKWVVLSSGSDLSNYYTKHDVDSAKMNVADTSSMLSNYLSAINSLINDTASLATRVGLASIGKLNISDTSSMLSTYLRSAALDAAITGKLNTSDTSSMLSNYLSAINSLINDTASLASRVNQTGLSKLNISDTSSMLSTYLRSAALDAAITGKLNTSDTAGMLSNYFTAINSLINDTASLASRVSQTGLSKLNISDTSSMLSTYLRSAALDAAITGKLNTSDTSSMLSNYLSAINSLINDTASLASRVSQTGLSKLNISDTSSMLSTYLRSAALDAAITGKLNTSDTSSMLSNYLNAINSLISDTASLSTRVSQTGASKLNISDTASMLSSYSSLINSLISDTALLASRIGLRLKVSDTASMLSNYLSVLNSLVLDTASLASRIGTHGTDTFTTNVTVNLGSGKTVGKYANGALIPSKGKTLDQFLYDIATESIHPSYNSPTASVSASPGAGNFEIGSPLTVSLTPNFNKNDAGASTATTLLKNGSTLGSSPDAISSLTSVVSYQVRFDYGQGACKNDNLGNQDCTGQIAAGSITSGAVTFTPLPKRYWGVCAGTAPDHTEIINAVGGGSELAAGNNKSGFSVAVPGDQYYHVFYMYASTYGNLSSIMYNSFESIGSFSTQTVSFTNASLYTQNYIVYVSSQVYSNASYPFTSVN